MKTIEIILKLLFVGLFAFLVYSSKGLLALTLVGYIFLGVSFLLGFVLIFNKKQSYGYPLEKHEVILRRIEGVLLVLFSVFIYIVL